MAAKGRKPVAALRIVNRLGKLAPAEVEKLLDATRELRAAGDIRAAMQAQRDALAALSEVVPRAAGEEGVKATAALERRVLATVRAAALGSPDALKEGTVEHELQPAGFEGLAGVVPAPAPAKKEDKSADERREKARIARDLRRSEQVARRAAAHAEKLAAVAARAEKQAAAARERAEKARHAADEAAARALELRRRG